MSRKKKESSSKIKFIVWKCARLGMTFLKKKMPETSKKHLKFHLVWRQKSDFKTLFCLIFFSRESTIHLVLKLNLKNQTKVKHSQTFHKQLLKYFFKFTSKHHTVDATLQNLKTFEKNVFYCSEKKESKQRLTCCVEIPRDWGESVFIPPLGTDVFKTGGIVRIWFLCAWYSTFCVLSGGPFATLAGTLAGRFMYLGMPFSILGM